LNSEIPANGEDHSTVDNARRGSGTAVFSRAVQKLGLPSPGFVNP